MPETRSMVALTASPTPCQLIRDSSVEEAAGGSCSRCCIFWTGGSSIGNLTISDRNESRRAGPATHVTSVQQNDDAENCMEINHLGHRTGNQPGRHNVEIRLTYRSAQSRR